MKPARHGDRARGGRGSRRVAVVVVFAVPLLVWLASVLITTDSRQIWLIHSAIIAFLLLTVWVMGGVLLGE